MSTPSTFYPAAPGAVEPPPGSRFTDLTGDLVHRRADGRWELHYSRPGSTPYVVDWELLRMLRADGLTPDVDQAVQRAVDAALEPGAVLIPAARIVEALQGDDAPTYYLLVPVPDAALDEEALQALLPDDAVVVCSGCGADVRAGDSRVTLGGSWECGLCTSRQTPDADRHDR